MRALLVHNPTATTTTPGVTDVISRALAADLKLEVEATKRRDHAGYLAAGAVHEGYDVVIALGGDGTVNEVVQGIAGTPVRLAVIPGGSTNVFARILGLPRDPVEATAVVLQKLRAGEDRRVTLGLANGRWFTFCAGWGYDAEVVRQVERRALMKRTVRQAAFLWAGWLAWATGRSQAERIALRAGEERADGLVQVLCCNANPYTYLGSRPSQMCPDAALDLGLDVTALTSAGFWELARLARTALTTGNVPRLPFVRSWHDRDGYDATATGPLPLHVDGELIGDTATLRLRAVRRALAVVA